MNWECRLKGHWKEYCSTSCRRCGEELEKGDEMTEHTHCKTCGRVAWERKTPMSEVAASEIQKMYCEICIRDAGEETLRLEKKE